MSKRKQRKILQTATLHTVMALTSVAAITTFLGCLPPPSKKAGVRPAPYVDTEIPSEETAYWQEKYKKNRMVPPEQYQVLPKAPRNNNFGEFDDNLYQGLDTQPMLPALPGDTAVMPAIGGPSTYAMAASSYSDLGGGYYVTKAPSASGQGAAASYGAAQSAGYGGASAPRPAGIRTDTHFYPIEQLVYGGDYPDIDKPESYRLMPKDVISVTVREHPEFSGKLTLQADGTVRIPNSPDYIPLRGMTVDEAADAIRRTLSVYVKGDCVVRVQANRARGGYYFVFGDVSQPGRFPMGMEPVKLTDAVMAANWEANPSRMDDGEDMGPAFPAASPRGKYMAPRSADMARVMLITPHRSRPVRTTHDMRQALLGMTADDTFVRPGQIIVVPSLDPEKNLSIGLDMPNHGVPPAGLMQGQGFSTANSSARLPEVTPPDSPYLHVRPRPMDTVDANMAEAFGTQHNTEAMEVQQFPDAEDEFAAFSTGEYCETVSTSRVVAVESVNPSAPPVVTEEYCPDTPSQGRRLRRAPLPSSGGKRDSVATDRTHDTKNWKMGL